jgi:hypothetical protein
VIHSFLKALIVFLLTPRLLRLSSKLLSMI